MEQLLQGINILQHAELHSRDEVERTFLAICNPANILLLLALCKSGDPAHVMAAKNIIRKIRKRPREERKRNLTNEEQGANQEKLPTLVHFINSLPQEQVNQYINTCFELLNTSLSNLCFFSKLIMSTIPSFNVEFQQIYYHIFGLFTSLFNQITPDSPQELVKCTATLFKQLYYYEPLGQEYEAEKEKTRQELVNCLLFAFTEKNNLQLTYLLARTFSRYIFLDSYYLFQSDHYWDHLLKYLSSSEQLDQLKSQPYFKDFLLANFVLISQISERFGGDGTPDNFIFVLGKFLLPISNLVPHLIPYIYNLDLPDLYKETASLTLLSIINFQFSTLHENGYFNDLTIFEQLMPIVYSFSHPSIAEIEEFGGQNFQNYYVSVFIDPKTAFNAPIGIACKSCCFLALDQIRIILSLLFSYENENSFFLVGNICRLFKNPMSSIFQISQTVDIASRFHWYVRNIFMNKFDGYDQRLQYSVLFMVSHCIPLFSIEDTEFIGKVIMIIQQLLDSSSAPVGTPLAYVNLSFASDLMYSLVCNHLVTDIPQEIKSIFLLSFDSSFSNSTMELVKGFIKESQVNFDFCEFIKQCAQNLCYSFSLRESLDVSQYQKVIRELSFLIFISKYQLPNYPTEAIIVLFTKLLESTIFRDEENYVDYVPFLIQNIIAAQQPNSQLALEFILMFYQKCGIFYHDDYSLPIFQSFVSFPPEILKNYVVGIIQMENTIILKDVFQDLHSQLDSSCSSYIDIASNFTILSLAILFSREWLPQNMITDICEVMNQYLQFANTEHVVEKIPDEHKYYAEKHMLILFYQILASLCLCSNFNMGLVLPYLEKWASIINEGYIVRIFYRRLHYAALLTIKKSTDNQELQSQIDFLLEQLEYNTYNQTPEAENFLDSFSYYCDYDPTMTSRITESAKIDKKKTRILMQVKILPDLPEFKI